MLRGAAALVLVLALPAVAAQAPVFPAELSLFVEPPERGVVPEGEALSIPIVLEVGCDPAYAIEPMSVQWSVTQLPAWASVAVDPPTDAADVTRCEGGPGGTITFAATASVRASAHAPAFSPEAIEVEAVVGHPTMGAASVRGNVPVFATYFSILDVQAPLRQLPGGEGLGAAFPLKVTNFGNAHTKVSFTAVSSEGVAVDLPEPIVLQSRQGGGRTIAEDVLVVAHPERETDRPLSFVLRWSSSYALDAQLPGDSGEIELIVLPGRGTVGLTALAQADADDARQQVPGLGAIGAGAALAVAAIVLRRGRG